MNCWFKAFFFVFAIGCGSNASADSTPVSQPSPAPPATLAAPAATTAPTPVSTPAPTVNDLHLADHIGIGSGFIDGFGNGYTGLSLRYWLSEKVCVDLLGYYTGYNNIGNDFNGNSAQEPYYYVGSGLAFKYNLAQLHKGLFLQAMGEGSYFHYHYQYSSVYEKENEERETWGIFGGLCLEYFLPFFDSLSIESTLGYQQGFDNLNISYIYNPAQSSNTNTTSYSSSSDGRIVVNGGTLGSIYLHYYF